MRGFLLEFLSRPGCHLCEEIEPVVRRWTARLGGEVRHLNVDTDPALAGEFGSRIPVVRAPSGRVLTEGDTAPGRLVGEIIKERIRTFVP